MKRTPLLIGLTLLGLSTLFDLSAHGGQYLGPGDVVPPNPGSGGAGRTPGPQGGVAPGRGSPVGPSRPVTSGPNSGSAPLPIGGTTGGPAAQLTGVLALSLTDFTRWQFWWEFNKAPYINLKRAVHTAPVETDNMDFWLNGYRRSSSTLKPTDTQIRALLPELRSVMEGTEQRDIVSSCLIAMAKAGMDHDTFELLPLLRARLRSRNQEIRETAAVSLGISQQTAATESLVALLGDTSQGRSLTGRGEVDDRTRSFAAYGLALVAHATENNDVKERAFAAFRDVVRAEDLASRNLRVAAVQGIGLLRPDGQTERGADLLQRALYELEHYLAAKRGRGEELLQAHAAPAIARLLQEPCSLADARRPHFQEWFQGMLQREKRSNEVLQSAALALGQMCEPFDRRESPDAGFSESLFDYYRKGKDLQTTYFALLALGQIGGDRNRDRLLSVLERGQDALQKPWAALALGLMAHHRHEQELDPDPLIGRALLGSLREVRNPDARSAMAIGLGLARHLPAAPQLRLLLAEEKHQDELAGYLCIGLALMGDQGSIETIEDLARNSVRRPERLRQAAIALGKLGDKRIADLLAEMLEAEDQNLARMSAVASALGFIGDRRSIHPLVRMLKDESLTDLTRAFAAVALGGVADKELLPWNSKIGINMNYRAAVETLTDGSAGILDIV